MKYAPSTLHLFYVFVINFLINSLVQLLLDDTRLIYHDEDYCVYMLPGVFKYCICTTHVVHHVSTTGELANTSVPSLGSAVAQAEVGVEGNTWWGVFRPG